MDYERREKRPNNNNINNQTTIDYIPGKWSEVSRLGVHCL